MNTEYQNTEKLPLEFEFMERRKDEFTDEEIKNTMYYFESEMFQTDYLLLTKPDKNIVRLL